MEKAKEATQSQLDKRYLLNVEDINELISTLGFDIDDVSEDYCDMGNMIVEALEENYSSLQEEKTTVGEQTKKFHKHLDKTYKWIDSDVKRFCRKAWFAAVKANGIKYEKK